MYLKRILDPELPKEATSSQKMLFQENERGREKWYMILSFPRIQFPVNKGCSEKRRGGEREKERERENT